MRITLHNHCRASAAFVVLAMLIALLVDDHTFGQTSGEGKPQKEANPSGATAKDKRKNAGDSSQADTKRGPARAGSANLPDSGHPAHDSHHTCPMHPQVKQDKPGKCPICGIALVPTAGRATADTFPSLEEMLKIALKHNPDIRAAQAKLQVAEK